MSVFPGVVTFLCLLVAVVLAWALAGALMFWVADWVRKRYGWDTPKPPDENDVGLDLLDMGD